MDYRVTKIGDGWEFLPEEERKKKFQFERLINNINRREKKIISDSEKLKELKLELRKWKKERTKQHQQLVQYHKQFIPGFSVSLSKNPKKKDIKNTTGSFKTSGNLSWTIFVTIQGERKPIYLGTMKDVNEKLDLIEGSLKYCDFKPHTDVDQRDKLTLKIEKLVYPLIREEMLSILSKEGNLDSFLNQTIKGMKYLDELYKKSVYFEEEKPKEEKPKGKRMEVFRPPPTYWEKLKENKEKNDK